MARLLTRSLIASLSLGLLALACAGLPATPPGDALQTAVVGTLTALPSPNAAASTPASAAPTATSGSGAAPTETPSAASQPAAQCPAPGNPPPVAANSNYAEYGAAIREYLSAGGSTEGLRQTLLDIGLRDDQHGSVDTADLNGDGTPETVVVIVNTQDQSVGPVPPGNVLIYTCIEGAVQAVYDSGYTKDTGGPSIQAMQDVTADGLSDLIYITELCGASTCFDTLAVAAWNGSSFSNIVEGDSSMAFPQITLVPGTAGVTNIQMYGGVLGSVGAGPPRPFTNVWGWNGSAIVLLDTRLDPAQYRFHVLNDADDAMAAGDAARAYSLYDRVITDDSLQSWEAVTDERAHLSAYALFRIMELRYQSGETAGANAAHDSLNEQYPPGTPGGEWGPVADAFVTAYQPASDLHAGCAAAVAYTAATPAVLEQFANFGYGNRVYKPGDVCPF